MNMKMTRFAFAGFRHGHIFDLLTGVESREDTEVVAFLAPVREDLRPGAQLPEHLRSWADHPRAADLHAEHGRPF